jgi:excisionase family DNA binding protein
VSEQVPTPLPALMSVPDAAKFLGLSRASAYRYADAGLLPIKRFGRRVYVVRARLAEFLASEDTTVEVDAA